MSYMAGDYYAGGFLSNAFRAVTRTIGGAIKGFATGGPIAGIAGAIGGAAGATRDNIAAGAVNDAATGGNPSTLPIHTSNPAVATFLRQGGRFSQAGKAKLVVQHNAALQPALHPDSLMGMSLGGGRRRMNWANGRALGRAERRITMAVKHMSKYVRWVHPGRPGHLAPKFKKQKSR